MRARANKLFYLIKRMRFCERERQTPVRLLRVTRTDKSSALSIGRKYRRHEPWKNRPRKRFYASTRNVNVLLFGRLKRARIPPANGKTNDVYADEHSRRIYYLSPGKTEKIESLPRNETLRV